MRRMTAVAVMVMTLGLHWGVLQTVAWSSMVLNYSQTHGLEQAVTMTFDGSAPCAMCHAITSAQDDAEDADGVHPELLRTVLAVMPVVPRLDDPSPSLLERTQHVYQRLRSAALSPPRHRPRSA